MLTQDSIVIHWHGMHQKGTNWMDGTTYVTQCPIFPLQSFTYRFIASPAGTHWYHSHQATQMSDGLAGLLIVHKCAPTEPNYGLFVRDYRHSQSDVLELENANMCDNGAVGAQLKAPGDPADCSIDGAGITTAEWESSLFGGRGRWMGQPVPLAVYNLTSGLSHRFRLVNSGGMYPFEISIDGHKLSLVASDGNDFRPIVADSFFIHPGETMDFVVVADQPAGRYWMRANTPCQGAFANAIR